METQYNDLSGAGGGCIRLHAVRTGDESTQNGTPVFDGSIVQDRLEMFVLDGTTCWGNKVAGRPQTPPPASNLVFGSPGSQAAYIYEEEVRTYDQCVFHPPKSARQCVCPRPKCDAR